jgi:hypothetical protein
MPRRHPTVPLVSAAISISVATLTSANEPSFNRKEDVIYGRKYGTALTMDVFTPRKDAKGIGLILVVSGGLFSSHEAINPAFVRPFIERGFTVFAVVHGSQPRFTVTEIVQDMNRAVRFIRHHAGEYGIDPDRIGIYGGSAGGHLSLMLGTAGAKGGPDAKDPVDRESSRAGFQYTTSSTWLDPSVLVTLIREPTISGVLTSYSAALIPGSMPYPRELGHRQVSRIRSVIRTGGMGVKRRRRRWSVSCPEAPRRPVSPVGYCHTRHGSPAASVRNRSSQARQSASGRTPWTSRPGDSTEAHRKGGTSSSSPNHIGPSRSRTAPGRPS